MQRFCWRELSEKLNWRLLSTFNVSSVVRIGDPAVLEPYALHVTFAHLPAPSKDPPTRDAWFLERILQLSMEYLLFMRANASARSRDRWRSSIGCCKGLPHYCKVPELHRR
ncbi:unnamed protein product [Peronospora destructor]|uniref:Cilium assembly protein DZIP1 N-terminal domain-containing protein n=1 Tax=Peronospora destructor TaxID=86335 RepID=A0AAV0V692_9STRA|nr:unnamed protein product [Peronospora destructor]